MMTSSYTRVPCRIDDEGGGVRLLAALEVWHHVARQPGKLIEHPVGRAERPEDELRAAGRDVLFEALAYDRRRPERRAPLHRRGIGATRRQQRRSDGARGGRVGVEVVVEEGPEVVDRHLAICLLGRLQ